MGLREEISELIIGYYNDEKQPTHKTTDEIMKLFEKRIDEFEKYYEYLSDSNKPEHRTFREVYVHFWRCSKRLKKELLK